MKMKRSAEPPNLEIVVHPCTLNIKKHQFSILLILSFYILLKHTFKLELVAPEDMFNVVDATSSGVAC